MSRVEVFVRRAAPNKATSANVAPTNNKNVCVRVGRAAERSYSYRLCPGASKREALTTLRDWLRRATLTRVTPLGFRIWLTPRTLGLPVIRLVTWDKGSTRHLCRVLVADEPWLDLMGQIPDADDRQLAVARQAAEREQEREDQAASTTGTGE